MKKIEKAQEQLEKKLFAIDDVTSISIGEKGGKPKLKVGVKKLDKRIRNLIPKQVQGYNVEIEETGELKALDVNAD